MGIDPSDERCIPFYDKMRELDMVYELRRITTLLIYFYCVFLFTLHFGMVISLCTFSD